MALRRHMKNFVKNYSEAEIKVREATSNDPWGPSSSLMLEISDLTYNVVSLSEIMNMIWHRMNDRGKNWRHVYKSLTLLDYLLKNGSKKVIQLCQEGFFNIRVLKDFQHLDEGGKDQGFHVREKAKHILALLKDEQLLYNEREIARRTRRRTSYAMLFPQKSPAKVYVPTPAASDPNSEFPPLEKAQYFPPKALPAAEQSQPEQVSSKAEVVQETTVLNIVTKKSSEDLIIFSEDESSPPAAKSTFYSKSSKEELETDIKACNIWNASSALSTSERNSLPQQKWDSGKKSKSSILSRVILKSPPKRRSGIQSHKVAATLYGVWSSNPEEFITTNKQQSPRIQAQGHAAASVETIYKSPTFQAFDPLGDSTTNPMKSASTSEHLGGSTKASLHSFNYLIPAASVPTADLSSQPAPRPDSTSSVGATSSYSFSVTSPESAVPNNTPQLHHVTPQGASSFCKDVYSFFPASSSDAYDCDSILRLLSENSKCSVKNTEGFQSRTRYALGQSWENSVVCSTPSVPNPDAPSVAKLPGEDPFHMSAEQKGMAMLEDIKNAVYGLRRDFCSVSEELHYIGRELTVMVASIQNIDKFFAAVQIGKDDSENM